MKKITIVGGAGTIGRILTSGLNDSYQITILDKNVQHEDHQYKNVDVLNYEQLEKNTPEDTDVIINLLTVPNNTGEVDLQKTDKMVDVFLKGAYSIYHLAVERKIPKVVFASSNHVTDYYEENGNSKLKREITINDYPYSKGLYGCLKLACENVGFTFHLNHNLSVINLRIGSVKENEEKTIFDNLERSKKTWLTNTDTVSLFKAAIESDVTYGTYYGVSDNKNKPWSMENAYEELPFKPKMNTDDLLNKSKP